MLFDQYSFTFLIEQTKKELPNFLGGEGTLNTQLKKKESVISFRTKSNLILEGMQ